MSYIAVFLPALISYGIDCKIKNKKMFHPRRLVFGIGIRAVVITWLIQCVITYVVRINDVTAGAFNSFPFFVKYMLMACILAFLLPFFQKAVQKYISIELTIEPVEKDKC